MVVVICGCDDGRGGGCYDGFVLFCFFFFLAEQVVVVAGYWFLWGLFYIILMNLFILF